MSKRISKHITVTTIWGEVHEFITSFPPSWANVKIEHSYRCGYLSLPIDGHEEDTVTKVVIK